ncbi:DUF4190 domain-containing protein [Planctomycetota bacterium]
MSTESFNPSPKATGLASASLILALASVIVGPFGAIPAIICGHKALSRMRKNSAIEGFGRALSGTILGYCFLVAFVVIPGMLMMLYALLSSDVPQ